MNIVRYALKAIKQLAKLSAPDHERIVEACQALVHFPYCAHVKKLQNGAYPYRLRVGHFRIFFNFDGAVHIISIEEVKRRNENTY